MRKIIITIFTLFAITSFILAQESISPLPDEGIKKETIKRYFKNKIKNIREESKNEIKEINEFVLPVKAQKLRLCINQNIKKLSSNIKKERRELIKNYQQQLQSATTDEEKDNLKKDYLNKLKEINKKYNRVLGEIKQVCQQKINLPKTKNQSKLNYQKQIIMISITDDGFRPEIIEIEKGTTVKWINYSSKTSWPASDIHPTHQLYPSSGIEKCGTDEEKNIFDACKPINPNESWQFTFNEVGEWTYHDHLNPQFTGKIIVK